MIPAAIHQYVLDLTTKYLNAEAERDNNAKIIAKLQEELEKTRAELERAHQFYVLKCLTNKPPQPDATVVAEEAPQPLDVQPGDKLIQRVKDSQNKQEELPTVPENAVQAEVPAVAVEEPKKEENAPTAGEIYVDVEVVKDDTGDDMNKTIAARRLSQLEEKRKAEAKRRRCERD